MIKSGFLKTSAVAMVLVCLLLAQVFLSCGVGVPASVRAETSPDVYVGVDLGYGLQSYSLPSNLSAIQKRVVDAKSLIDQVSPYTNFFVLGTRGLSQYPDELNETLQYAYEKGLSFITFTPEFGGLHNGSHNESQWYQYANDTWGDRLLGFVNGWQDEPGGKQLDLDADRPVQVVSATGYADAATQFETQVSATFYNNPYWLTNYPYFTSDYGLFWFDYKAGYDALFAEFILGNNNQLTAALCRGAATAQNKQWGVIITYSGPSFIESGQELFNDMVLAYDNGAKYIVVFDSTANHYSGSLTPDHFQAMQQFWQYIKQNPRKSFPVNQRVAYVLPKDYGVGFRWRNEKVWGLFDADNVSIKLYDDANSLLSQYGSKLDVVYDDGLLVANYAGYKQMIYWNTYPPPTPSLSPSPSLTQSPMPQTTPSPSPSMTPISPDTPIPTIEPMPIQTVSPSPDPTMSLEEAPFKIQDMYVAIAILAAVVIASMIALVVRNALENRPFKDEGYD